MPVLSILCNTLIINTRIINFYFLKNGQKFLQSIESVIIRKLLPLKNNEYFSDAINSSSSVYGRTTILLPHGKYTYFFIFILFHSLRMDFLHYLFTVWPFHFFIFIRKCRKCSLSLTHSLAKLRRRYEIGIQKTLMLFDNFCRRAGPVLS